MVVIRLFVKNGNCLGFTPCKYEFINDCATAGNLTEWQNLLDK